MNWWGNSRRVDAWTVQWVLVLRCLAIERNAQFHLSFNYGWSSLLECICLIVQGYTPSILYPKQSSSDLMKRLVTQVTKMGINFVNEDTIKQPSDISNDYALVVDAIFGFSFRPPLRSPFDTIIDAITKSAVPVFSIDVPSGAVG